MHKLLGTGQICRYMAYFCVAFLASLAPPVSDKKYNDQNYFHPTRRASADLTTLRAGLGLAKRVFKGWLV